LPRLKTLSMKIIDWLSKKLQKGLEYSLVHATQFWLRFMNSSGLSKICAKTRDWWSETAMIFDLRKSPPESIGWWESWNVITSDKTWVYSYDAETNYDPYTESILFHPTPRE
jgi:hypothetical protein